MLKFRSCCAPVLLCPGLLTRGTSLTEGLQFATRVSSSTRQGRPSVATRGRVGTRPQLWAYSPSYFLTLEFVGWPSEADQLSGGLVRHGADSLD